MINSFRGMISPRTLTNSILAVTDERYAVFFDLSSFVDVKEGGRGCLAVVLAYDSVEDDWEILARKLLIVLHTASQGSISAWLQL